MTSHSVIAIDGNAASGKGALARSLAKKLGFAHMDTGVLYRLVALRMLENGYTATDEESAIKFARMIKRTFDHRSVTPAALKTDAVSHMTSLIAAYPKVRAEILDVQREFATNPPDVEGVGKAKGAVLDGRDIGTIVFPAAPVKFFITADAETRASRRFREMRLSGFLGTYEAVLAEMRDRDTRDASREASPMRAAPDAVILDTTSMSMPEVLDLAISHVHSKLGLSA